MLFLLLLLVLIGAAAVAHINLVIASAAVVVAAAASAVPSAAGAATVAATDGQDIEYKRGLEADKRRQEKQDEERRAKVADFSLPPSDFLSPSIDDSLSPRLVPPRCARSTVNTIVCAPGGVGLVVGSSGDGGGGGGGCW